MPAALNLAGIRFGRLVALRRVGTCPRGNAMWRCVCDCGAETSTQARSLGAGHTRSCGCLQREAAATGRIAGRVNSRLRAGGTNPHLWQAAVTYYGAHQRIVHARGRAAERQCPCGAPAQQWSYDHCDPDERHQTISSEWSTSNLAYSLDPGHYVALCKPCHRQIDTEHRIGVLACL